MIYVWKSGYRSSVNAEVAGKVCEELEKKGELTAERLVEISKPKDAPLHNEFEWNNTKAATLYREYQGRNIINHIEITTEESTPIRAFFNIHAETSEYEHINTIIKDADDTQLLLDKAYTELLSFKAKYLSVKNYLQPIYDAIKDIGDDRKQIIKSENGAKNKNGQREETQEIQ